MTSKLPKIAPKTVINRTQTPVMVWLRDKLNAIGRDRTTPPPGLPTSDGESKFYEMNRFPNTQAARSRPSASLPVGVYHKLSDNYYLDRDARRRVQPPKIIYIADSQGPVFKNLDGEISCEATTELGASLRKNFGLELPTPGFGYAWQRNKEEELPAPKCSKDLGALEKYDKFTYSD
uniref:NADH dehydrogenase [ubiquinone] 1 alpha subcomplex subunit 7 n=1 Tax=Elaeophora elaphi TaxID=1147741 RepID=A0A0R3RQY8_9BILA